MSERPLITLNAAEIALAVLAGLDRYHTARAAGIADKQISRKAYYETDVEGLAAEIAAGKHLNAWPDFNARPQAKTFDLLVTGHPTIEGRVDVKQTAYPTGRLLVRPDTPLDATDIYVLAIGRLPTFRLAGWLPATEVIRPDRLTEIKGVRTYAATQEQLRPL